MNKQDIIFIKKSNKFIVWVDEEKKEFKQWAEAVAHYNNATTYQKKEISAVCGMVGKTIAYSYK